MSENRKEPPFAEPIYHGNMRFFRLSDLMRYDAACAGEPEPDPLSPEHERFLTAKQVRERYGNVSDMWIWRRLRLKAEREEQPTEGEAA